MGRSFVKRGLASLVKASLTPFSLNEKFAIASKQLYSTVPMKVDVPSSSRWYYNRSDAKLQKAVSLAGPYANVPDFLIADSAALKDNILKHFGHGELFWDQGQLSVLESGVFLRTFHIPYGDKNRIGVRDVEGIYLGNGHQSSSNEERRPPRARDNEIGAGTRVYDSFSPEEYPAFIGKPTIWEHVTEDMIAYFLSFTQDNAIRQPTITYDTERSRLKVDQVLHERGLVTTEN